jgi:tetratricopeptide (TPR) repeat protein
MFFETFPRDLRARPRRAGAGHGLGNDRCQMPDYQFSRFLSCFALLVATTWALAAIDQARLDAADALFKGGKPAEAQAAYEAILKDEPGNFTAQVRLGVLALRRDEPEKAISLLEKALERQARHSETHRILGDAYGRAAQKKGIFGGLGLGKKCLGSYQKAVELDPKNIDAHASLFEFYRQAPGIAGGSTEKALAEATAVKQLDPARGRILFATFYVSEKKFDRALAEFDAVLKTTPDDYVALYQIGRLAALTGQFIDRGVTSLRRCLELAPPSPNTPGHAAAQWRLGQILEKKNDRAGARAAYEAAVKLDPNFAPPAEALRKLK